MVGVGLPWRDWFSGTLLVARLTATRRDTDQYYVVFVQRERGDGRIWIEMIINKTKETNRVHDQELL